MRKLFYHLLFICCFFSSLNGKSEKIPSLIPLPKKAEWKANRFELKGGINIILEGKGLSQNQTVLQLIRLLTENGVKLSDIKEVQSYSDIKKLSLLNNSKEIVKSIRLQIVPSISGVLNNVDEGYTLDIESQSILIKATSSKGLFYAIQTLKQIASKDNQINFFRGCTITDWPAFSVRGFMQDVGRNYMSPKFLKEQIDVMSNYKLNLFHFHVTDNPGWRLESKRYPQLQSPSATSRKPGMFYSQTEFLDLVRYCSERKIVLVPELDIPGHTLAFRKAFGIERMSEPRVKQIFLNLINELCDLVSVEQMPYLHIGTDEVDGNEKPADDLLPAVIAQVKARGRQPILWRPGFNIKEDTYSITQLWSTAGRPLSGHQYLDSRLNYLNHLDPLNGMGLLFFDQICQAPKGDSLRLGGILCCWNDNMLLDECNVVKQNPVYPGIVTYSESAWTGNSLENGQKYLSTFPQPGTQAYVQFRNFEERLIQHRNLYFKDKPFPYIKNTQVVWKIIGPFDHKGDLTCVFPIEQEGIKSLYNIEGKEYRWRDSLLYGGTINLKHHFGWPSPIKEKEGTVYALSYIYSPINQSVGCWIGFQGWSRSGRRGGPLPQQGQWHTTHPKVWVNKEEIAPPIWKHPGLSAQSDETPFFDEDYFYREPSTIHLKKGVNEILLKVPQGGSSWKWMFTFIPVEVTGLNVREVTGLQFGVTPDFKLKD
ncbi:MAG: beta-N-acetylhexosaminidase [Bacteroidetes bacterium]|nr:beta-N-acetylhexosaminidase [Bacteroidota bacterium]